MAGVKILKRVGLRVCERLGLFALTQHFLRGRLHILCYHGFELEDECRFRPQLFISRSVFESRLQQIAELGFKVFPLEEALSMLKSGSLPPRAVAITVDDGFPSTLSVAQPILHKFNFPATVYVTSYYMEKEVPVFRLAIQYLVWKATATDGVDESRLAIYVKDLIGSNLPKNSKTDIWALINYGEALKSEQERQTLVRQFAEMLKTDTTSLYEKRLLSMMSRDEVGKLSAAGIDIQLHTHRHRFPSNDQHAAFLEIEENRSKLEKITGRKANHFCYPSGIFEESQWPWLDAMGIASATTCLPGLNTKSTPKYGLRRFLDSEAIDPIEFKAELAGFNELLRSIKACFVRNAQK